MAANLDTVIERNRKSSGPSRNVDRSRRAEIQPLPPVAVRLFSRVLGAIVRRPMFLRPRNVSALLGTARRFTSGSTRPIHSGLELRRGSDTAGRFGVGTTMSQAARPRSGRGLRLGPTVRAPLHLAREGPLPPRKVQVQVIEIRAIYRGVTAVASLGYKGPLIVHSDSDTAVGQMNGTKAVDNSKPGASDIRAAIAEVRRLEEWTDLRPIYEYTPREQNRKADALARKAREQFVPDSMATIGRLFDLGSRALYRHSTPPALHLRHRLQLRPTGAAEPSSSVLGGDRYDEADRPDGRLE